MSYRPFRGELMTCVMCQAQLRSDRRIESGWTCFMAGGNAFYVCPDELPTAPASKDEYVRAYKKILTRILRAN